MTTAALNDRIRRALAQEIDTGQTIDLLVSAVQQKPFNAELRQLLVMACLEQGQWQEAAAAINEKSRFCGLKPVDGNLIIKLHAAMIANACKGPAFDEFIAHPLVQELTADTAIDSFADVGRVRQVAEKFMRHGMFDSAKDILLQAIVQMPSEGALHLMLIRCLFDMGALAEAAAAVNNKSAACGLNDADVAPVSRLYSAIVAEGVRGAEVDRFLLNDFVQQLAADNSIYCRFESLGDDCEFGTVQRRLGQEPLGLLRFASIPLATLIKLLDNGFANFAAVENCELRIVESGDKSQYDLYDRAYGYQIHTFINVDKTSDMPSILVGFCARVQFLTRKLLDDLATGEK
ncbi:MAG TPA: hypothetical protein VMH83_03770, partial [Candidatus Acidoferrum sp.]|nr:hypothetical protein [Candidatus Acidoferrum sp.]